jgi:malate dehydrogenase (oxaloacetate-decarboxylating)
MSQTPVFKVALRGDALLNNPRFNKGTAFTHEERDALGLDGRLPFQVNTLDKQCARAYDQFKATDNALRQNSFLQSLKDQNWVLYYRLISTHLREMIPVIYTPTEVSSSSSCQARIGLLEHIG